LSKKGIAISQKKDIKKKNIGGLIKPTEGNLECEKENCVKKAIKGTREVRELG